MSKIQKKEFDIEFILLKICVFLNFIFIYISKRKH